MGGFRGHRALKKEGSSPGFSKTRIYLAERLSGSLMTNGFVMESAVLGDSTVLSYIVYTYLTVGSGLGREERVRSV